MLTPNTWDNCGNISASGVPPHSHFDTACVVTPTSCPSSSCVMPFAVLYFFMFLPITLVLPILRYRKNINALLLWYQKKTMFASIIVSKNACCFYKIANKHSIDCIIFVCYNLGVEPHMQNIGKIIIFILRCLPPKEKMT